MRNEKLKMKYLKRSVVILSSRTCLLWLFGGWILYYVLSAIWMDEAFANFVNGIEGNILIQAPLILFLVSGYLNLVRSSKEILKRSTMHFILWMSMPLGALLFLTAFSLSISQRESGQRIAGEGDLVKPPWVQDGYRLVRIEPGLRPSILNSEWDVGIFAHEPKLTMVDRSSRQYTVGAFPPEKLGNTYYHILNFGIAPGIRLQQGQKILNEGYMPLRILTFGSSDFFEIPPLPHRFLVSLEPEKSVLREKREALQYNLYSPRYRVRVFRGDRIIHEGNSGEGIRFDGLTLRFFEPSYWVLIEAVKDPAMPLLRFSLFLIVLGIPLTLIRLFAGRK